VGIIDGEGHARRDCRRVTCVGPIGCSCHAVRVGACNGCRGMAGVGILDGWCRAVQGGTWGGCR
jgi:hypothetical protein